MASTEPLLTPVVIRRPSVTSLQERLAIEALPNLSHKIEELGLTEQYLAFKQRYHAWRKGDKIGARGDVSYANLTRPDLVAANRGFTYWYPSVQEWVWKRTMTYWIAVSFFEGSIFFTISSFAYNRRDLGNFYTPMGLYGYMAGKVCFFICTYFMCLETINVHGGAPPPNESDGEEAEGTRKPTPKVEEEVFYLWPFRYQTAFANGEKAGIGRWPYLVSVTYLGGVLAFTVGMTLELGPQFLSPEGTELAIKLVFVLGSFLFAAGGVMECGMNNVFTQLVMSSAQWGALLNFVGGLLFFVGSFFAWYDGSTENSLFGWGSVVYMVSSSVQLFMWKDEQFGLSFMTVLNYLGDPSKLASLANGDKNNSESRFSFTGAVFVHVFCVCGALSTYNFNIRLKQYFDDPTWPSLQAAFDEFLPCLIAHMMLAMTSAVLRTPKLAPFKQLYTFGRYGCLILTLTSGATLCELLYDPPPVPTPTPATLPA